MTESEAGIREMSLGWVIKEGHSDEVTFSQDLAPEKQACIFQAEETVNVKSSGGNKTEEALPRRARHPVCVFMTPYLSPISLNRCGLKNVNHMCQSSFYPSYRCSCQIPRTLVSCFLWGSCQDQ